MGSPIKDYIRKTFIAALATVGLAKLHRARKRKRSPLLRVVEFHDLRNAGRFADIVSFLATRYHVITPDDCYGGQLDASDINILLTFDDGYASWVGIALPVLATMNVKGLFFVNSGLLDRHGDRSAQERYVKDRLLSAPLETLSWDGLRALHYAGHAIGGHTRSHPRLSNLKAHECMEEIVGDKKHIEAILQADIAAFAYPFGEHTAQAERCLRDAGYRYAFSNEARFATLDLPLRIPRMPIDEAMPIATLTHLIEGACDVYEEMKAALRVQQLKMALTAASQWSRRRGSLNA